MAERKKKKKAKKLKEKAIDEYQLRRDLRKYAKKPTEMAEELVAITKPQFSEDYRIGGLEG